MDLGESINPAIDIGQVEGAFVQGYGLFMMEQILHTPTGVLLTRGPGAYKIPSFNDIPGKKKSSSSLNLEVRTLAVYCLMMVLQGLSLNKVYVLQIRPISCKYYKL